MKNHEQSVPFTGHTSTIAAIRNLDKDIEAHIPFYFAICVFTFVMSPGLSVLFQLLVVASLGKVPRSIYIMMVSSIAFMLGLMNVTKIPESDMAEYLLLYHMAAGSGFLDYIWFDGKEPLYKILTYTIFQFSGGSEVAFIVVITFAGYFLLLSSILKLGFAMKLQSRSLTAVIILIAFFPQIFSISMHVIRQFLAGALLTYLLVEIILGSRRSWFGIAAASQIHASALFFVPLLMLPVLYRPFNIMRLIIVVFLLLLSIYLLPVATSILSSSGLDGLAYVGKRAGQAEYAALGHLGLATYIFSGAGILAIIYSSLSKVNAPLHNCRKGYFLASNLFIILSVFIFFMDARDETVELAGRYSYYLYFISPILAVMLMRVKMMSEMTLWFVVLSVVSYFVININSSVWHYDNVLMSILNPLFVTL